jgi:hypothetical protein
MHRSRGTQACLPRAGDLREELSWIELGNAGRENTDIGKAHSSVPRRGMASGVSTMTTCRPSARRASNLTKGLGHIPECSRSVLGAAQGHRVRAEINDGCSARLELKPIRSPGNSRLIRGTENTANREGHCPLGPPDDGARGPKQRSTCRCRRPQAVRRQAPGAESTILCARSDLPARLSRANVRPAR